MNDIFLAAILWVLIKIWGAVEPSRASFALGFSRVVLFGTVFLMVAAIVYIAKLPMPT